MLWQVCVSPNESKWDADCSGFFLEALKFPTLNEDHSWMHAASHTKMAKVMILLYWGKKNGNDNKKTPHSPFVLDTGHQQREQVEGEEDAQAEQHALHIHISCGQWEQKSRSKLNLIKKNNNNNLNDGSFGQETNKQTNEKWLIPPWDSQLMAGETRTSRSLVRLPASISSSGRRG